MPIVVKNVCNRLTTIAVIALFVLLTGCAATPAPVPILSGFSSMDWETAGAPVWASSAGVNDILVPAGGADSLLVTRGDYRAYKLSVDFWVDSQVNSGILIHCQDRQDISPLTCYEINIWDEHPNQAHRTGAIVTHAAPLAIVNTAGRWNHYEITATADVIEVILNGEVVSRLREPTRERGFIVLQRANGGEVRFRNLILEPATAAARILHRLS